jgi:hypothetical protein
MNLSQRDAKGQQRTSKGWKKCLCRGRNFLRASAGMPPRHCAVEVAAAGRRFWTQNQVTDFGRLGGVV